VERKRQKEEKEKREREMDRGVYKNMVHGRVRNNFLKAYNLNTNLRNC